MPKIELKNVHVGTSVLIAAINETFSLEQTVRVIRETCSSVDVVEILLLLSPKKTTPECIKIAERIVAEKSGIPASIVWQRLPFAGGAYRDGFQAAKGGHAIMMSADLETPPEQVAKLVEMAKAHPASIVTMSRWMPGGGFSGYSKVKQVCNFIFQKIFSVLFWTRLSDLTYGYRIFPVELLNRIDWHELRHPFFLETSLVPLRLGVAFIELPVQWKPRQEAESQNTFLANFKYFKTAFRIRFTPWKKLLISTTQQ